MTSNDLHADLVALHRDALPADGRLDTAVTGLTLYRASSPSEPGCWLYEPSLAVILQGAKRVTVGDVTHTYGDSEFLLTAIDVPTVSQITRASRARPYRALSLKLDLNALRRLLTEIDTPSPATTESQLAMSTSPMTPELLEPLARLLRLLRSPQDVRILGAVVQQEILYRLLTGAQGPRLRRIAMMGTQSHQITKVIAWLREHYALPLRVEELAEIARMGVSTLHHNFRAVTGLSPLQFQKQLRLHEARRLMLTESVDAGSAALAVGYESQSQYTREYRRLFGEPPMRDVKALRHTEEV